MSDPDAVAVTRDLLRFDTVNPPGRERDCARYAGKLLEDWGFQVAYHDYEGVVLEMGERDRLLKNLGDADVMLLRNHGPLAVGRSVGEAFNNI